MSKHKKNYYISKEIFLRFRKNPVDFIRRALYKTIIGPLKYSKGNDYDATRYWHDRFSKYAFSLKGSGNEGLSEEENAKRYKKAAKLFIDICQTEYVNFRNVSVLEIGCGTGFYTQLLHNLGVKNLVCIDITDVLFPELRKRFPKFKFVKRDVTTDEIEEKFDLIVKIDVIQHIVKEDKFSFAMENVKNCLSENGIFILSPITDINKKHLFYVRSWSLENIKRIFPGYIFRKIVLSPKNYLLIIKKP